MFMGCSSLTSFNSSLPSLINGTSMFDLCKLDATSINSIALGINKTGINGNALHLGIETATLMDSQVKRDLGLILHKGWSVYIGGTSDFSSTSPKYAGCTTPEKVKSKDASYLTNDIVNGVWVEHLPDLTRGCTSTAEGLFKNNNTLTTFTSDLSSLTNGSQMFYSCKSLTTFSSDLKYITTGFAMFHACSGLTSFTSDLSNMLVGDSMFTYCYNLTTFNADLSSLTTGIDMFKNCKLNLQSLKRIANTLPQITNGTIDIMYAVAANEQQEAQDAIALIRSKGWRKGTIEAKQS